MNCEQAETLLAAFVFGEVDPPIVHELEEHIERCETCSAALREVRAAAGLLEEALAHAPAPALSPDRREKLAGLKWPKKREPFWLWRPINLFGRAAAARAPWHPLVTAAAGVAVLVLIAGMFLPALGRARSDARMRPAPSRSFDDDYGQGWVGEAKSEEATKRAGEPRAPARKWYAAKRDEKGEKSVAEGEEDGKIARSGDHDRPEARFGDVTDLAARGRNSRPVEAKGKPGGKDGAFAKDSDAARTGGYFAWGEVAARNRAGAKAPAGGKRAVGVPDDYTLTMGGRGEAPADKPAAGPAGPAKDFGEVTIVATDETGAAGKGQIAKGFSAFKKDGKSERAWKPLYPDDWDEKRLRRPGTQTEAGTAFTDDAPEANQPAAGRAIDSTVLKFQPSVDKDRRSLVLGLRPNEKTAGDEKNGWRRQNGRKLDAEKGEKSGLYEPEPGGTAGPKPSLDPPPRPAEKPAVSHHGKVAVAAGPKLHKTETSPSRRAPEPPDARPKAKSSPRPSEERHEGDEKGAGVGSGKFRDFNILADKLESVDKEIAVNRQRRDEYSKQIEDMPKRTVGEVTSGPNAEATVQMKRLQDLRSETKRALKKYTSRHSEVKKLQKQIEVTEQSLAKAREAAGNDEVTLKRNAAREELEKKRLTLQAEVDALTGQRRELQKKKTKLAEQIHALPAREKAAERFYGSARKRFEERDYEKAEKDLKAALALNPEHKKAAGLLSRSEAILGKGPADRALMSRRTRQQVNLGSLRSRMLKLTDEAQKLLAAGRHNEVRLKLREAEEIVKVLATRVDIKKERSRIRELTARADKAKEKEEREKRRRIVRVNPFVSTKRDNKSTFALEADTGSYTLARSYLRRGKLPPKHLVRVEEFVNAFRYNYPGNVPNAFTIHTTCARSPFRDNLFQLKIGIKAKRLGRDGRRRSNIVICLDTSSSMGTPERLPLAKTALRMLVANLAPADRVTIVTYGTRARLVLDATPVKGNRAKITKAIDSLQPGGSTNVAEGLAVAYLQAHKTFNSMDNNMTVLVSDGIANVGPSDAKDILRNVKNDRRQGITLTSVGVGTGQYNDRMMEQLANNGDGRYVFIDTEREAERVFVEEIATMQVVAKDAKIQVEFDPGVVRRYRLLGYENRDIADRDFRNDAVDAGEIGSGQSATALYELELLKAKGRIGTVRVRYRDIETGEVEEIESAVMAENVITRRRPTPPRFRLAACAAQFAEILRGSPHADAGSVAQIERVLAQVTVEMPADERAAELLGMVRAAKTMLIGRGSHPSR